MLKKERVKLRRENKNKPLRHEGEENRKEVKEERKREKYPHFFLRSKLKIKEINNNKEIK